MNYIHLRFLQWLGLLAYLLCPKKKKPDLGGDVTLYTTAPSTTNLDVAQGSHPLLC